MKHLNIKFKKLNSHSLIPEYMSNSASGADIYACEEIVIEPGEIKLYLPFFLGNTGRIEGQIRPRSGLELKNGISVLNRPGTIDSDYRGEVKVILINLVKKAFTVKYGDRIAQLVITEVARASFQTVQDLDEKHRSEGGIGHTAF
jgi:dUTP pyrophosphatase